MGYTNNIEKILRDKARSNRQVITANLELLPVCNLDCKMCYIRTDWKTVNSSGGLKTKEEWITLAKQLKDAGVLFLLLTGGEIFLYPEFQELYIELYKMGFSITLNTNATMIDESVISWLSKFPPKCISISIYGSNDDVYKKLCGTNGMFFRLNHAICLLKQTNINIEAKTIITPFNAKDLENIWEYTKRMQIPYEVSSYSFPPTRKCDKSNFTRFTPKEAVEYTIKSNKMMSDETRYIREIQNHLQKYEDTKDIPGTENYGMTCSGANTSCWITWKGDMTPCGLMNIPTTKPFETGFLEAWKELKQKVDQIHLSTSCSHCKKRQVCTVCPASAYAETGDISGTSQYHCAMTDIMLKDMSDILKQSE